MGHNGIRYQEFVRILLNCYQWCKRKYRKRMAIYWYIPNCNEGICTIHHHKKKKEKQVKLFHINIIQILLFMFIYKDSVKQVAKKIFFSQI